MFSDKFGPFKLKAKSCKTLVSPGTDVHYFIVLRDDFYLVRRERKVIEVYSYGQTFDLRYEVRIDHVKMPSGFTQSEFSNCVYLGDRREKYIYCITPRSESSGDREMINTWLKLKGNNESIQSLSALFDGRLAVLVAIQASTEKTWRGRIDIYLPDKKHQMIVPVPHCVDNPWSFTATGRNTFALTYGSLEFGIIRLDPDGNIKASHKDEILSPRSIRFDPDTGSIFVAVPGRRRIQQFNLQLEPVSIVHEWNSSAGSSKADAHILRFLRVVCSSFLCRFPTSALETIIQQRFI